MPIIVSDYIPVWPALFAQPSTPIQHCLGAFSTATIEHIGSTSVPGLAAKPIIDMDGVSDVSVIMHQNHS